MTFLQSIVLGIVQGLGEFLPISSSAHLVIIPWLLKWEDPGLTFDVALHGGTLIALLIYFRKEWISLIKGLIELRPRHFADLNSLTTGYESKMAVFIVLATIPGALIGLALEHKAEVAFRDPGQVAIILALMGVVLWFVDSKSKKNKALTQMTLTHALIIGVSQGLAVIPGISRSGVTITTALAQGFNRKDAARFSFFLSMPIILGACILKLRHLTGADLTPIFWSGVVAAAVSGYFAIGGLIRLLQTRTYGIFAGYRIVVGLVVWAIIIARH